MLSLGLLLPVPLEKSAAAGQKAAQRQKYVSTCDISRFNFLTTFNVTQLDHLCSAGDAWEDEEMECVICKDDLDQGQSYPRQVFAC